MKTVTAPLAERNPSSEKAARFPHGLLLILALVLLAAGCAPASVAGSWAGVSLSPDGLVMANVDHVTRLNEAGVARWEYPTAAERNPQVQFYASPAVTEDVVYIGGYDHKVYALNHENGQPIWINEDARTRIIAGLVVANGRVYVGQGDHGIMALDQRSGEMDWAFETSQGVWAEPLVMDDVMFVPSMDGNLYALNAITGDELWRQYLDGASAGKPAYAEGVVYIGSFAGKVFALNASDGSVLGTFETSNWVWGGPAYSDGLLFVGDLSGNLFALNAETMTPVWQRQVAREAIRATPLVVGDLVIVGSRDNTIYAVNRDNGTQVWQQPAGGDVLGNLNLLNDELVVITTLAPERQLVAYTLDGQEVWVYPAVVSE